MLVLATMHNVSEKWVVEAIRPPGNHTMTTQSQTALRSALEVVAPATSSPSFAVAGATVAAFEARIDKALAAGDASADALRSAQWGVVDAMRDETISDDQALALLSRAAEKRGVSVESIRTTVKPRALAALAVAACDEEKRDERDPLSYGQSLINARKKAAKEAEQKETAKGLRKQAGAALAAEMGAEYDGDFSAEYAPEIAERAASLAANAATVNALIDALKAAKEAGISRDRLAGMIVAVYGDE